MKMQAQHTLESLVLARNWNAIRSFVDEATNTASSHLDKMQDADLSSRQDDSLRLLSALRTFLSADPREVGAAMKGLERAARGEKSSMSLRDIFVTMTISTIWINKHVKMFGTGEIRDVSDFARALNVLGHSIEVPEVKTVAARHGIDL